MLLGGLDAADSSSADILLASSVGARALGTLPTARHDTAAVAIDGAVYLFGGGTATSQLDEILRVDSASGRVSLAGRLPAASSDSAAAAVGRTAYVVGGYTGTRWLDSIVAWRPGGEARVVARLPTPLRYAAVAAAGGRLVIAGGSLETGAASDAVFEYVPGAKRVTRIGRLPAPTTHAAAATIGGVAYVIGGRGARLDTPTTRVVSIDPQRRRVRRAGTLTSPLSDLAAASFRGRILLAGGRGADGPVAGLGLLTAGRATRTTATVHVFHVYARDGANMLAPAARDALPRIYVPNSLSNTVDVIDPKTEKVVEHFAVGALPQHVVPAWNLKTLYVTNDSGNSLTPIDPRTGKPGKPIHVDDPYNMYFTPSGYAGSTSGTLTPSRCTGRSTCPASVRITWTSPRAVTMRSSAASSRVSS